MRIYLQHDSFFVNGVMRIFSVEEIAEKLNEKEQNRENDRLE